MVKCKVTIQKLVHDSDVELPEHLNCYLHVQDGFLYVIELPEDDEE